MKTSETKSKSDSDSSEWTTQEELERLIDLAPTAIRRQALRQQLMAMKKSGDVVKEIDEDTSVEWGNAKAKQDYELFERDNATPEQTDSPVKQDSAVAEEVDISVEQHDVIINEADALDEEKGVIAVEQDDTAVEKSDVLAEKNSDTVESTDALVKQDDAPAEEITGGASVLVGQGDMRVEKDDIVPVKLDDAPVEKAVVTTKKNRVSVEETALSAKQKNDKKFERNKTQKAEILVEEDAVLKQGKQPDNFYVYMRRKSRFSPFKIVLLSVAVLLILIISIMLISQSTPVAINGSTIQGEIDSTADQVEGLEGQVKHMLAQIKTSVLGEEKSIESSNPDINVALTGAIESQDAILKMYEAQSKTLDALLKFDEFIELNGASQSQREIDIKNLLQSAQIQQRRGQYNDATEFYHRVSEDLERFINIAQQLIAKKNAAELARLNWESYRWRFYRDTRSLSVTPEEVALIDLETLINDAQQDQLSTTEQSDQFLARYSDIERRYTKLLDTAKAAVKARAAIEPIRQQWRKLLEERNLTDSAITAVEQHYRLAVELEAAGDFQKAIDSYELAGHSYTKALGDFSIDRQQQ